ncbi:MAG TPA: GNAT family protein [Polyangiales bacterium]|nr:GNAT family protein [Polyangiales bacterium]
MRLDTPTLTGQTIRLTPLTPECLPELTRAALCAPEIWQHIPYRVQTEADVVELLESALAEHALGTRMAFATRLATSDEMIGGTSFFLTNKSVPTVEIGATWIVPAWQRSAVNTEAKLLQLGHCFEVLGCQRVELKTDIRNLRSRAAITRLGAREEGILRSHMRRADGSLRDTVMFSIIAAEWPEVRDRLTQRLQSGL